MIMHVCRKIRFMLIICAGILIFNQTVSAYEYHAMVSWGDQIIVCGPGTDAALDSEQSISTMMKRLKGRGFTGIYWRADIGDFEPNSVILNNSGYVGGLLVESSVSISESFNVLQYAQAAAEAEGLEFWVWVPIVYSDGGPQSGPTLTSTFTLEHRYVREHPETLVISRNGVPYYGQREFAYSGARTDKVNEILYFAKHWGIKNIMACMRSESSQFQLPPDKADRYGFNQPIVDQMLSRYGINILTNPKFDVYSASWNPTDPDLLKLHDLRGEYLTQFYRDLRSALNAYPGTRVGVMFTGGDYLGPVLGNVRIDWRKWIDEGLVYNFLLPTTLAATEDFNSPSKGYLTDNLAAYGKRNFDPISKTWGNIYPASTFRSYADNSDHPETRILQTSGDRYHRTAPPAGASGWRVWIDQESSDLGWYQRWRQWKKDLIDFGHIKFFKQNFDDFPEISSGRQGGWGDYRYIPSLRYCPGLWWYLGDGTTGTGYAATAQSDIKHGETGKAIRLKRNGYEFYTRHLTVTQRSYWSVDNAIMNGSCTFDFWVYRPDTTSAVEVTLTKELNSTTSLGLSLLKTSVKYRKFVNGQYAWFGTAGVQWTPSQWQKFSIQVNLQNKTYSAYTGTNNETMICTNVPYSPDLTYCNMLRFLPQGDAGSICYLDDVGVNWVPELYYAPKGKNIYLADDFESHTEHQTVYHTQPDIGQIWSLYFVEHDLSFGDGWKCMAVPQLSDGTVISSNDGAKLTLLPNNIVTTDLDIFVETGKSAIFGLAKSSSGPDTALVNIDSTGKIKCWNGSAYTDSGKTITNGWWYHFQIAMDCSTRTYKVVAQQSGTIPFLVGSFTWGTTTAVGDGVVFKIATQGDLSGSYPYVYYDNIEIHYGLPVECGDEYHPKPAGDFSGDCSVDYIDLAQFSQGWLGNVPACDIDGNGIVNLKDFLPLASNWLSYTLN